MAPEARRAVSPTALRSRVVAPVYIDSAPASVRLRTPRKTYIQMTACGSFALEVPRRNLRRWSFVSWEKVYSLASELCVTTWGQPTAACSINRERGGEWVAWASVSTRTIFADREDSRACFGGSLVRIPKLPGLLACCVAVQG